MRSLITNVLLGLFFDSIYKSFNAIVSASHETWYRLYEVNSTDQAIKKTKHEMSSAPDEVSNRPDAMSDRDHEMSSTDREMKKMNDRARFRLKALFFYTFYLGLLSLFRFSTSKNLFPGRS